ncbi:NADH--cytochrome b5 reductase 1-like [Gossypium australe]|uniref:NADH--cytochrome b5 reductase 1-like n=1 Tax=Gossypium australe TaxID=47621 RepID=A0A5B6WE91_9ROSI|nr:NADH--cytochrome b5 reductase 1-like [Gossypium australe]
MANNFEIKPAMILKNLQFRRTIAKDPNLQAPGSIMTWDKLVGKFLQKFFPISKTVQLRREISMFKQLEGEGFHEAWEHFKTPI